MAKGNEKSFLYVLEEDGLHLYEGTYCFSDYGLGYAGESIKTDDGRIIDTTLDGIDPTICVKGKRDDVTVRSEMLKALKESIAELTKKLSGLEKGIILEKSEEEA